MLLIAPTEPPSLKLLGKSSSLPERFGADILWGSGSKLVGVQRKEYKDLLASIHDGRLQRELAQMKKLAVAVLVVEGQPRWTLDGEMVNQSGRGWRWDRLQHFGLLLSVQSKGVWVLETSTLDDTARAVKELKAWAGKARHDSLDRRPKAKGTWGKASSREFGEHLLQGFEGIGPVQAAAVIEHFGKVPLRWTVGEKDLMGVPGIGKTRARKLMDAL